MCLNVSLLCNSRTDSFKSIRGSATSCKDSKLNSVMKKELTAKLITNGRHAKRETRPYHGFGSHTDEQADVTVKFNFFFGTLHFYLSFAFLCRNVPIGLDKSANTGRSELWFTFRIISG